jgi:hypothetical protein
MIYAKRISSAQASGAFKDMNSPEVKSKFRRLALMALIGTSGVSISLAILIFQRLAWINIPFIVIVVLGGIFGLIGAVAGLLIQKEINQKL